MAKVKVLVDPSVATEQTVNEIVAAVQANVIHDEPPRAEITRDANGKVVSVDVNLPVDIAQADLTNAANAINANRGVAGATSFPFTEPDPGQGNKYGHPGYVSFDLLSYTYMENIGIAKLKVARTQGRHGEIKIDYATSNGTAEAGKNYLAKQGTLVWGNKDDESKEIEVVVIHDNDFTGNLNFNVTLSNPVGTEMLVGRDVAAITIVEVDPAQPGVIGLDQITYLAPEDSGFAILNVSRTLGHDGASSVAYTTVDGVAKKGEDYTEVSGVLNWADKEMGTKTISVPIINDQLPEGDENFTVVLSDVVNSALGPAAATVTVRDVGRPGEPFTNNAAPGVAIGTHQVWINCPNMNGKIQLQSPAVPTTMWKWAYAAESWGALGSALMALKDAASTSVINFTDYTRVLPAFFNLSKIGAFRIAFDVAVKQTVNGVAVAVPTSWGYIFQIKDSIDGRFNVNLTSNAATGYKWRFEQNGRIGNVYPNWDNTNVRNYPTTLSTLDQSFHRFEIMQELNGVISMSLDKGLAGEVKVNLSLGSVIPISGILGYLSYNSSYANGDSKLPRPFIIDNLEVEILSGNL